ncbi:MAG: glycosyltransferase, partial [Actinobacteria bacterium]|nr:glycosyltransferase [Actinomycetota bacterium]
MTISLCFPTLNESQTIGFILNTVKNDLYNTELLDEVIVMDSQSSDSTAEIADSFGFKIYQHKDILPKYSTYKGKGEGLWKSLFILKGDIIAWCDSD